MAHKHNRRRNRPRSRHNKAFIENFDSLSTSLHSMASSGLASESILPRYPQQVFNLNGIATRHWQNRYTAWQNREVAQQREAARLEGEQLKMFGGEPGDDPTLCYKMIEVFEGMDWIDSLD